MHGKAVTQVWVTLVWGAIKLDHHRSQWKLPVELCIEKQLASNGGAVGKAVTSDNRDPWFESHHGQYSVYGAAKKGSIKRQLDDQHQPKVRDSNPENFSYAIMRLIVCAFYVWIFTVLIC